MGDAPFIERRLVLAHGLAVSLTRGMAAALLDF
jgi:hypothetical protein